MYICALLTPENLTTHFIYIKKMERKREKERERERREGVRV